MNINNLTNSIAYNEIFKFLPELRIYYANFSKYENLKNQKPFEVLLKKRGNSFSCDKKELLYYKIESLNIETLRQKFINNLKVIDYYPGWADDTVLFFIGIDSINCATFKLDNKKILCSIYYDVLNEIVFYVNKDINELFLSSELIKTNVDILSNKTFQNKLKEYDDDQIQNPDFKEVGCEYYYVDKIN